MSTKTERVIHANEMLVSISKYGGEFFLTSPTNTVSSFEVDLRGKVWFHDSYSRARIYTHYAGCWLKFTHGCTMRSLVNDIVTYIRTGTPVPRWHFGPWPDSLCGGDLWGYGKSEMARLRKALARNPAMENPG